MPRSRQRATRTVYYVLRRAVGEADAADAVRDIRTVIDVRLPDEQMIVDAARIKADHPMADADAFGAALAIATGSTLWTGNSELLIDAAAWEWRDLRQPA